MEKFNLDQKGYDRFLKQSRKLAPCKCNCGSSASVKIHYALYGPIGVRVECNICARKGPMQGITTVIGTDDNSGSIATPVTEKSLIKGIKLAVKAWSLALAAERINKMNE